MVTHSDQIKTALSYFNISGKFSTTTSIKLDRSADTQEACTFAYSAPLHLLSIDYSKHNQRDLEQFLDYTKDILSYLGWSEKEHTILRFSDTTVHL